MNDLPLLVRATLHMYRTAAVDASRALARNAWVVVMLPAFSVLVGMFARVAGGLGMAGGLLVYFAVAAATSAFLSILEGAVGKERVQPAELAESFGRYLGSVVGLGRVDINRREVFRREDVGRREHGLATQHADAHVLLDRVLLFGAIRFPAAFARLDHVAARTRTRIEHACDRGQQTLADIKRHVRQLLPVGRKDLEQFSGFADLFQRGRVVRVYFFRGHPIKITSLPYKSLMSSR